MISEEHVQGSIGDTARYLAYGSESNDNKVADRSERVAWEEGRGVLGSSMEMAVEQMRSTAETRGRRDLEKPVYHVILSWQSGNEEKGKAPDDPSKEEIEEAVDRVLGSLDLEDHQAWMVAHKDTETPHVHVMVNRVHPRTGKAWERSYDQAKIYETLRELEADYGWDGPEEETVQEVWENERPESPEYWEAEHEKWDREPSLRMWAREHVRDELASARNWKEAEETLEEKGASLEPRHDRGMVLKKDGRYVALSSIDPQISRPKLESRFGQKWEAYQSNGIPFRESLKQLTGRELREKRAGLEARIHSSEEDLRTPDHKSSRLPLGGRDMVKDHLEKLKEKLETTRKEIERRTDPPEEMSLSELLSERKELIDERDQIERQTDVEEPGLRSQPSYHRDELEDRISTLEDELNRRFGEREHSVVDRLAEARKHAAKEEPALARKHAAFDQAAQAYDQLSPAEQEHLNLRLSEEGSVLLDQAQDPDRINVRQAKILDGIAQIHQQDWPKAEFVEEVRTRFEGLSEQEQEEIKDDLPETKEEVLGKVLNGNVKTLDDKGPELDGPVL